MREIKFIIVSLLFVVVIVSSCNSSRPACAAYVGPLVGDVIIESENYVGPSDGSGKKAAIPANLEE